MGVLAMISARDLHSPTIVLPRERFGRRNEGATNPLPLMPRGDR